MQNLWSLFGRLVDSRFESFIRAKDKLETQQKSQQVRKPRRKSATQSKTPANSDLENIRKILEPYGHKIWIRNNSYYIVIDGENQKFDTNGELYTFLKAKGFI